MATNRDFRDLFFELSNAGVEFLVVGAHAVMAFTEPRFTKDLDVWVKPSRDNAARVLVALQRFGAPTNDLNEDDLSRPGTIFQMGVAPNRIDVITTVEGVEFAAAYARRLETTYDDVRIGVMSRDDLIINKRAVGRPQDLLDVERLERSKKLL